MVDENNLFVEIHSNCFKADAFAWYIYEEGAFKNWGCFAQNILYILDLNEEFLVKFQLCFSDVWWF